MNDNQTPSSLLSNHFLLCLNQNTSWCLTAFFGIHYRANRVSYLSSVRVLFLSTPHLVQFAQIGPVVFFDETFFTPEKLDWMITTSDSGMGGNPNEFMVRGDITGSLLGRQLLRDTAAVGRLRIARGLLGRVLPAVWCCGGMAGRGLSVLSMAALLRDTAEAGIAGSAECGVTVVRNRKGLWYGSCVFLVLSLTAWAASRSASVRRMFLNSLSSLRDCCCWRSMLRVGGGRAVCMELECESQPSYTGRRSRSKKRKRTSQK